MAAGQVRIKKEWQEVQKMPKDSGVSADLVNGSFEHWKGYIKGPDDTPYAGGIFVVDITIPKNYPFVPPKMKFDTKLWHPNVSSATGAICLDILKDEWSPALTLRTCLLSLQALLYAPNPDSPQDAEVATQYKRDIKAFESTARMWTTTYAKPPAPAAVDESAVRKLTDMGFSDESCRAALLKSKGNEEAALNILLSGP